MARGDKEYFRTEVAFVDGPEFVRMSGEAFKVYEVLQARCIATRRITLYGLDHRWIAGASGLTYQRVPSALKELACCRYGKAGQPLINILPTPYQHPTNTEATANQQATNHQPTTNLLTIEVVGMDRNNPKFKFSDSPHGDDTGNTRTERSGAEQSGTENSPLPPKGEPGEEPEKPTPEHTPKPKRSTDPWDFSDKLETWKIMWPCINVETEIANIREWWEANPAKVRGRRGGPRATVVRCLARKNQEELDRSGGATHDGYVKPAGWTDEMFEASLRYGREDREGKLAAELPNLYGPRPRWGNGTCVKVGKGSPEVGSNGGGAGQDRTAGMDEGPAKIGEVEGVE